MTVKWLFLNTGHLKASYFVLVQFYSQLVDEKVKKKKENIKERVIISIFLLPPI